MANLLLHYLAKNKFIYAISIFVLTGCYSVSAIGLGGLSGAHLRSPVGAEAFSLGGANSASPDYLCTWWNPAYLANIKGKNLSIGEEYRSLGRAGGTVGFEFKIPPRMGMGLVAVYRGNPVLKDLYDNNEKILETGSFTTISAKIGLAYLINRKVSAGLNVGLSYKKMPTDFFDDKLIYSSSGAVGGFDLSVRIIPIDNLDISIIIRNILGGQSWVINPSSGLSMSVSDTLPMSWVLASKFKGKLLQKTFYWSSDLTGYVVDGAFSKLNHAVAVWNNGFEWQGWEKLFIRAGIRDLLFTSDIFDDSHSYKESFTLAFSAGVHIDMSSVLNGLSVNVGLATDKVMAGLEEQIDFTLSF